MRVRTVALGALGALIAVSSGCSAMAPQGLVDERAGAEAIDHEARGELMYQMLLAELAGRRGRVDMALSGYLNASRQIADPRLAERAARLAVYAKDWDSAAEAGRRWAELEPDSLNAQRLLAGVYMQLDQATAAADAYERVLALSEQPFDVGVAALLSSFGREPRGDIALRVAQTLADRHPRSAMGQLMVARLAAANGERERALRAYDRAIALKPDLGRAHLFRAQLKSEMGRTNEALSELHAFLHEQPGDMVGQLGLVRLLVDAGRHAEAEAQSSTLYQRFPDRGDVMFEIGLLSIDSMRLAAASTYLERAIELDYRPVQAHYFLGRVAQARRDFAAAIDAYDRVESGDYQIDAGVRAAELAADQQDPEVGLARLAALRGRLPDGVDQQPLVMAEAAILERAERFEQALAVLDRALAADVGNADLRYARGLAAERAGDFAAFEADMRALIDADARDARAMNALGYSLTLRGERLAEARALIEGALTIAPDDPAYIDSLGWVLFKLGDREAAVVELRRAHGLLSDPEIAAHLSEALWASGEREEALQILDAAQDEFDDDPRLLDVRQRLVN